MGSTGDQAEISTNKGKDLFKPDEDLFNHAFGTEKQTASDPYDQRAMKRMITRPFSEDKDAVGQYVERSKEKLNRFEEDLSKVNFKLFEIKRRGNDS